MPYLRITQQQLSPDGPVSFFRKALAVLMILITMAGCEKTGFTTEDRHYETDSSINIPVVYSRTEDEIEEWLTDKQVEFGEAASGLIERMLPSLRLDEKYRESYGNDGIETFIVVPIEFNDELTEHMRADLPQPLQYLLMVEDSTGHIRRGDLIMFYPDSNITAFPSGTFNQYFTTQSLPVDGTFQVISLNNIKQYEMDIVSGNPAEHRLWEGRAPVYEDDNIVCIDWYLVTTIYYTDGTIEEYEDFLYTQCYGGGGSGGGGGGGGNGTTPPVLNHYPITKTVTFIVDQQLPQGTLEHWTMSASFVLAGECYPNNPASNYFTSAPTQPSSGAFVIIWGYGMHLNAIDPWYITHSAGFANTGLTSNKNAWANFSATLSYPNQPLKPSRFCYNSKHWPSSIFN